MQFKTLNRIINMIDEGKIKRIYCDGWNRNFINKIYDLFGDRVDVIVVRMSDKVINKIEFKESDCLLFDDMFIKDYKKYDVLIQKAKHSNVFIKILTEDIYCVH